MNYRTKEFGVSLGNAVIKNNRLTVKMEDVTDYFYSDSRYHSFEQRNVFVWLYGESEGGNTIVMPFTQTIAVEVGNMATYYPYSNKYTVTSTTLRGMAINAKTPWYPFGDDQTVYLQYVQWYESYYNSALGMVDYRLVKDLRNFTPWDLNNSIHEDWSDHQWDAGNCSTNITYDLDNTYFRKLGVVEVYSPDCINSWSLFSAEFTLDDSDSIRRLYGF